VKLRAFDHAKHRTYVDLKVCSLAIPEYSLSFEADRLQFSILLSGNFNKHFDFIH
jgi:hypothetical protein